MNKLLKEQFELMQKKAKKRVTYLGKRGKIKMSYITLVLKIEEDDIKDYLSNYYDDDELEKINIKLEASDVVNAVLQDHFSDFMVIDENTMILTKDD